MASQQEVKRYLAYWFQLGKEVILEGKQETLSPQPVIRGDRYSQVFESCWHKIIDYGSDKCHLRGTEQTIAELLSSNWEVASCANCQMPIPMKSVGVSSAPCPCFDLPTWPNTELPQPREPISTQNSLRGINSRLQKASSNS